MRAGILCITAAVLVGAAGADELIVTTSGGLVQSIDLEKGVTASRGVCAGPVRSLAVAGGVIYLGSDLGNVYVFDLGSDQITGFFTVPSDNNAMAWLGNELVIGGSNGELIFVDPTGGTVEDSIPQVGTDITAIGVDAGGLFVGGHSSIAMRAHLGQNSFDFFAACGSRINAMAFGSSTMFLGGSDFVGDGGTIYKFDKFVGGVSYTGTYEIPNDASAVLWHQGLLYVGGSDGSVIEIEPETGAILRTFAFGQPVTGVAPASGLVSCAADYDASGELNFFDVQQFVDLFIERRAAADTTGDGIFNFFDVQQFVHLFQLGCE